MFKRLKNAVLFAAALFILTAQNCMAVEDWHLQNGTQDVLKKESETQLKLTNTGVKILNSNKIDERIVFAYDNTEAEKKLKLDKTLINRQIVVYGYDLKYIEDDNELAAFLSRRIAEAYRSYSGAFNGRLSSLKIKAAPKKYQIVFDKIAVDYMVKAGYNPVAMITFVNKSKVQKRTNSLTENLTSKRLAIIYEYIFTKYPYYLKNNEYFFNENYQNFLLTSQNNRKMLEEKIQSGSKEKLKYE